jgi:5'-nucleotidase
MVTRPVVLLDVDGVMADFVTAALRTIQEVRGLVVPPEQITTWHVHESIPGCHRWWPEVEQHMFAPGWCEAIPPFPGAREGLASLRQLADVFFVTSPWKSPTWAYERTRWLRAQMGVEDAHERVVSTQAKHLVAGDVFVDDKPENVAAWAADHPSGLALLWDQPTNRTSPVRPRCASWDDLVRAVRLLGEPSNVARPSVSCVSNCGL